MKDPEVDRNVTETKYTINDLPDEVIEFVLSFVPPYKDLHDCMQVCKRWRRSVLNVVRVKRRKLLKALTEFNVQWQCPEQVQTVPTIAKRYSHSAIVHENSMYVFGGCTNSMTTFNDLWCLNLSSRCWVRPVATGVYPTPKACSSLVCYGDSLVLFGGWAYPCLYPFHQSYQLFNELHIYDVKQSRWCCVSPTSDPLPPPIAGHSVSVHRNTMVVFGGMQRVDTAGPLAKSNAVWRLELDTLRWRTMDTTSPKPRERYGHSQTALNDEHALIMGGCGGPNGLYHDVWLLIMKGDVWTWKQVEVRNSSCAPPDTWCHPTCLVGEHLVVLNRAQSDVSVKGCWRPPGPDSRPRPPPQPQPQRMPELDERRALPVDIREPVRPAYSNGAGRPLNVIINDTPRQGLSLSAFNTSQPTRSPSSRNRERQLELLRHMEEEIRNRQACVRDERRNRARPRPRRNALGLYLLDVTGALKMPPYVSWLRPRDTHVSGPEETLLYTLVHGKAELIMFGGIQKDNGYNILIGNPAPSTTGTTKVSNSLYFISAPVDII